MHYRPGNGQQLIMSNLSDGMILYEATWICNPKSFGTFHKKVEELIYKIDFKYVGCFYFNTAFLNIILSTAVFTEATITPCSPFAESGVNTFD